MILGGQIVETGGKELAAELHSQGYDVTQSRSRERFGFAGGGGALGNSNANQWVGGVTDRP